MCLYLNQFYGGDLFIPKLFYKKIDNSSHLPTALWVPMPIGLNMVRRPKLLTAHWRSQRRRRRMLHLGIGPVDTRLLKMVGAFIFWKTINVKKKTKFNFRKLMPVFSYYCITYMFSEKVSVIHETFFNAFNVINRVKVNDVYYGWQLKCKKYHLLCKTSYFDIMPKFRQLYSLTG
jgi:hypothetical protein